MQDTASIFHQYQSVRHRLPQARFDGIPTRIGSLLDITQDVDAFVFDAFGVLNVGETPIPGAAERLDQLRAGGHAIRILSNAASYDHVGATRKFQRLGMAVASHEIVTSRDAAISAAGSGVWGCIAAISDGLSDIPADKLRLGTDRSDFDVVDGFLFLSTADWTQEQQAILTRSLISNPRPVIIANADIAAPRDHGFSLEPGYYGHLLADAGIEGITFFGKPFAGVFQMVQASLPDIPAHRIAMCGDTLHTDILGAAALGWKTVLVEKDGMFNGTDTGQYIQASGFTPTWRVARI